MDGKDRKNVVLICLDDAVAFWKYKSIFREVLQTPNLDRVCAQSTAFHSAYCQAPMCSPSRASLMSGLSPHHSGVTGPAPHYFETLPVEEMWPYALKQNDYFCSSGGKVMLGFGPLPADVHKTIFTGPNNPFHISRRKRIYKHRPNPDPVRKIEFGGYRGGNATIDEKDDARFYDHQVADSAISFLDTHDKDVPFYREVGFLGPMDLGPPPIRFKEMYKERSFLKPRDWENGFPENAIMDIHSPENMETHRRVVWKKSVRNYFSAVTHTDYHLGRVWDAIKASRHADNTVVIIVSDHGFHLGERNRFRKHTLLEQVANVPLIVHDPSKPVAQVIDDPVGLVDVAPTVMDYAGLPPLKGRIGRSLRPQMEGARAPDRAVPTFFFQSAGVRKGKYRFIHYDDGSTQFFDLSDDWWQTKDLGSAHPDYAEMQAAHAACCAEYGFDLRAIGTAA